MKVRLKFDWLDYGILHKCGSVVDVSDKDGALLVSSGHEQVHQDTPSRINPDLYGLGCLPDVVTSGLVIVGDLSKQPTSITTTSSGYFKGVLKNKK